MLARSPPDRSRVPLAATEITHWSNSAVADERKGKARINLVKQRHFCWEGEQRREGITVSISNFIMPPSSSSPASDQFMATVPNSWFDQFSATNIKHQYYNQLSFNLEKLSRIQATNTMIADFSTTKRCDDLGFDIFWENRHRLSVAQLFHAVTHLQYETGRDSPSNS